MRLNHDDFPTPRTWHDLLIGMLLALWVRRINARDRQHEFLRDAPGIRLYQSGDGASGAPDSGDQASTSRP